MMVFFLTTVNYPSTLLHKTKQFIRIEILTIYSSLHIVILQPLSLEDSFGKSEGTYMHILPELTSEIISLS